MEVVNVPKPMGRDKRLVAKAATMETAVAQASAVKPAVPQGIRIGDSPDEEQQGYAEYAYSFVHTCSPSAVSTYSCATIAAHHPIV
jgi:hypothetical protein